mmetsp:Transcript_29001/g.92479  ORF Transcript_29001/g.92479 Transcript_29001/m.92479 type:complete len:143 (-) Transcript_29001:342-770(-)
MQSRRGRNAAQLYDTEPRTHASPCQPPSHGTPWLQAKLQADGLPRCPDGLQRLVADPGPAASHTGQWLWGGHVAAEAVRDPPLRLAHDRHRPAVLAILGSDSHHYRPQARCAAHASSQAGDKAPTVAELGWACGGGAARCGA